MLNLCFRSLSGFADIYNVEELEGAVKCAFGI